MARAKRASTKTESMIQPTLTGEIRTDMQLWRLSFVLADIAKQTSKISEENNISKTANHMNALPLTQELSDV